jgi:hypothetical protein
MMMVMLPAKQDVGLENESDDQSRADHSVVIVPVVEGVEENPDDDLYLANVLPLEVKANASDFLALDFETAADLEMAESAAEVEADDLRCSFELGLIG